MYYGIINGDNTKAISHISDDDPRARELKFQWDTYQYGYKWKLQYPNAQRIVQKMKKFALMHNLYDEVDWDVRVIPLTDEVPTRDLPREQREPRITIV